MSYYMYSKMKSGIISAFVKLVVQSSNEYMKLSIPIVIII